MTAADELRDPRGWVLAGLLGVGGGAAAALAGSAVAAGPVGLAIGAVVLGTKVALGARGGGRRRDVGRLPPVPPGSEQAHLLTRADIAQRRVRALAGSPADDWVAGHIGGFDEEAEIVAQRLAELAGRITVADNSLASAQPQVLARERAHVAEQVARESDPSLRAEREQTLRAVDAQVEAVDRLVRLRERLLSRMRTAVLGLEGLAARMGELVALGSDPVSHDRAGEVLTVLTGELETLRSGLNEAETMSRQLPG
jgi:hypothetical protein